MKKEIIKLLLAFALGILCIVVIYSPKLSEKDTRIQEYEKAVAKNDSLIALKDIKIKKLKNVQQELNIKTISLERNLNRSFERIAKLTNSNIQESDKIEARKWLQNQ